MVRSRLLQGGQRCLGRYLLALSLVTMPLLSAQAFHLPYNLPYQKTFSAYLTYEIALSQGDVHQAGLSALVLARMNHDVQMAQQALYLLMEAHAYAKAQEAAMLWIQFEPNNAYAQQRYQALILQNMPLAQRVRVLRSQIDDVPINQQALRLQELVLQLPDPSCALKTFKAVAQGRLDNLSMTLAIMSNLALRAHHWQEAFQYAVQHYQNEPSNEANLLFVQSMFVRQWRMINAENGDNEPLQPWVTRLGMTLKQEGIQPIDLQKALTLSQIFLAKYPQAYKVRLGYSKLLILSGNNPEAIQQLTHIQKRFPRGVTVLFYKGIAAYREGNTKLAFKTLDQFLRVASGYPEGYAFEGFENMVDAQDYARQLFANTLSSMGLHKAARYQLALIDNQTLKIRMLRWREIGLAGSAQRALNGLAKIKPTQPQNQRDKVLIQAQLYLQLGQIRSAIHVLNAALHDLPLHVNLTPIVLQLSTLYQKRGQYDSSVQLLSHYVEVLHNSRLMAALSVAITNQVVHSEHNDANSQQQLASAFHWAKQAIIGDPYAAESYDARGWVLLQMGKDREAIQDFHDALNIAVQWPIQLHLLQAYWQSGQPDQAYQLADKLINNRSSRQAVLSLMTTLGMKKP